MNSDYRPYPPPSGPWVMAQTWSDLLFAHWPVDVHQLRPLVLGSLALDTYAGRAWVGLVPFQLSHLRPRGLPAFPWISTFPELNLRTYVKVDEKPGIYFFCLDAGNPLAVTAARLGYHLPYFRARMTIRHPRDWVLFSSHRTHGGVPPAEFVAQYRPTSAVFQALPGTLEYFLTARYCLYAVDRQARVYRGEIDHRPWPLQPAEAKITKQTLAEAHGIGLPDESPLLHFAQRMDMVAWLPQRVEGLS